MRGVTAVLILVLEMAVQHSFIWFVTAVLDIPVAIEWYIIVGILLAFFRKGPKVLYGQWLGQRDGWKCAIAICIIAILITATLDLHFLHRMKT